MKLDIKFKSGLCSQYGQDCSNEYNFLVNFREAIKGVSAYEQYRNSGGTLSESEFNNSLLNVNQIEDKVDKENGKGLSSNDFTDEDKAEVDKVINKVDKVAGKGLSTNDFTDADKAEVDKVDGKFDKASILQTTGDRTDAVMSQDASTRELNAIKEIIYDNTNWYWYGFEYDKTVTAPEVTRIGNLDLHKSLPIQNTMKGCLLNDDGTVNKYLDENDWSNETLDGSQGQVMVEIPRYYFKCEEDGDIVRMKFSTYDIPDYVEVKKQYVGAYEATVQRSASKLCSVQNTTPDYRGGANQSDWDTLAKSVLGKPATSISRINYKNYARNRGNGSKWNGYLYSAHLSLYHLFILEYGTRNSQAAYTAELTVDGYKQGGLGNGVTDVIGTNWSEFNGYNPFIPCGHTNILGNGTGEVEYTQLNDAEEVLWSTMVNRYRGVELPFGHIFKWADGINIDRTETDSKAYIARNPEDFSDTGVDGYEYVGLESRDVGYVKNILAGKYGDVMPSEVGGGSTTNFCDYHYTSESAGLRGVRFGGFAINGSSAGFACSSSALSPALASAHFGSRLCFLDINNN